MNAAIAKNFDESFEIVRNLVAIFCAGESRYREPDYCEQNALDSFIENGRTARFCL